MRISYWSSDVCSSDPTSHARLPWHGPRAFLPGVLSDALEPIYGTDSLGYSLILMSMLWPWAAFHFFLANRTIARDIARAEGVADLPRVIGRASGRGRGGQ